MNLPFEVPGIVRVEMAKPYRTVVATEDLLDDKVTAEHYRVGTFDALGKPIVLGEDMTYVDWRNPQDVVWRVYEWHLDEASDRECWVPTDDYATRDEAVNEAARRAASISQAGV